jgi:hypothetical protein
MMRRLATALTAAALVALSLTAGLDADAQTDEGTRVVEDGRAENPLADNRGRDRVAHETLTIGTTHTFKKEILTGGDIFTGDLLA